MRRVTRVVRRVMQIIRAVREVNEAHRTSTLFDWLPLNPDRSLYTERNRVLRLIRAISGNV